MSQSDRSPRRPAALEGVSVLDLSSVGPAARATRILSDYGAHVTKVAPARARAAAAVTPPPHAYSGHRGMRRVLIDLKQPAGREAFLALARDADVVVESFRPGVVKRLGIDFEDMSTVNPRIIYCSTSGYGQSGPRAAWAGHDLNYLGVSGYLYCSERNAEGAPALPGATIADIAAGGMHAAMAIMAALLRRQRSGRGEYLDVSVADGALAMMSLYADEHLATGIEPGPRHYVLTGRYACYGVYRCAGGGFVSVAAIEPAFWRNLCVGLVIEEYIDAQYDDGRQDELRSVLKRRFLTEERDVWVDRLGPRDCCVAPVNLVSEAVQDEQYVARDAIVGALHPHAGRLRQLESLWAGSERSSDTHELPDLATSDTESLLSEAGFDPQQIESLQTSGAIA